jgi:hypothetical protein
VLPKYHIFLGFILSLILFLIFPSMTLVGAGIIFLSSFLIDVDHYIYYVLKEGKISLKVALNHFFEGRKRLSKMTPEKRRGFYSGFCFLHGIEILVILFILGMFVSSYFFFILIGFAFHIILDITEEIYKNLRIDKISIIYDWFKYKKLKFLE